MNVAAWNLEVLQAGSGERLHIRGGMRKLDLMKEIRDVLAGELDAPDMPHTLTLVAWWGETQKEFTNSEQGLTDGV